MHCAVHGFLYVYETIASYRYVCVFHLPKGIVNCPAQKAKSQGGILLTCAYIERSTYSWNIQSVCQKKSWLAWSGAAWNLWVKLTFLLFMPASKRWLEWCKTQDPPWNRLGSLWLDLLYSHTSILFFVTCYQWHSAEQLRYGPKDTC